jgi:hypothetical protein
MVNGQCPFDRSSGRGEWAHEISEFRVSYWPREWGSIHHSRLTIDPNQFEGAMNSLMASI